MQSWRNVGVNTALFLLAPFSQDYSFPFAARGTGLVRVVVVREVMFIWESSSGQPSTEKLSLPLSVSPCASVIADCLLNLRMEISQSLY